MAPTKQKLPHSLQDARLRTIRAMPFYRNMTDFNALLDTQLTTSDTGVELNLDSKYKAAENLNLVMELCYIHRWLDKDVWAATKRYLVTALTTKTPGKRH